jgi:hypothetical protein
MQRLRTAALLSMCFLAVSACSTTKRAVEPLRPDLTNPERFICEPAGTRPTIRGEDPIDLSRAQRAPSVAAAMAIVEEEVTAYVASVRGREAVVANYVLSIEGKLFVCGNNMAWQRDFYRGLTVRE